MRMFFQWCERFKQIQRGRENTYYRNFGYAIDIVRRTATADNDVIKIRVEISRNPRGFFQASVKNMAVKNTGALLSHHGCQCRIGGY